MGIINLLSGIFLIAVPAFVLADTLESSKPDSND